MRVSRRLMRSLRRSIIWRLLMLMPNFNQHARTPTQAHTSLVMNYA
jgi:hypothetical protein